MKRELAIEFSRVTEAAALAGYKWLGRGQKEQADGAAVFVMRHILNEISIDGEVVIGEGEIDEAPMLYLGEKVGRGGAAVDIAIDPIEGTRMTAMGQPNAITVLAIGPKGSFFKAPDMYMEKLVVGPQGKGLINLDESLADNIIRVASAMGKPLSQFSVMTLAKPRHDGAIKLMQSMGVRVFAIPDGDVAAAILTCMPFSEVDMVYCVGGAPEGVISAAVVRALDGDMQGRIMLRSTAKGQSVENDNISIIEQQRCDDLGVEIGQVLKLEDLVKSDDIIFSATGITKGDLLDGVTSTNGIAQTETLLVRGKSRTVRRIKSVHYLERKDDALKHLFL